MQEKYYLTIDECPLKNWRLANEDQFDWLRKKVKVKFTREEDLQAWEILYNDFIAKVGLNPEFKDYLELVKLKIEAINEFIQNRKRFILNEIQRLDNELKQYQKSGQKGLTIQEILPLMTKHYGTIFREKDLTVLEYFDHLKQLQNG
jgi:hypothetical protein